MPLDQAKLEAFQGRMFGELTIAMSAPLVAIGDRLGLFKAMAAAPVTPKQLAKKTKTHERSVREWLSNMAAAGIVEFDAAADRFSLPPEHAAVLADDSSPAFMMGGFDIVDAAFKGIERTAKAFRTGKGVPWGAQDPALFRGTERFFAPGYRVNLVASWLPALDGVVGKLESGAKVADVGCGHGISTALMAAAFPMSRFTGFDVHEPSIKEARKRAKTAGVKNAKFAVATAKDFPGTDWDLVTFFDCLHDMGDPLGAAKHVRRSLAKGGTWMIVEPFANDTLAENCNPIGRVFYAASAQICVQAARSQGGEALGTQAGEACLTAIVKKAGFKSVRRATATPFNLVLEARG